MSFNFVPPPQSKSSDYSKIKLTQDEIIALQIANDANIANARKQMSLGVPEALPQINTMTPQELLSDNSRQEALAQQNLKSLGFRDQEVSDILVQIRRDPQLSYTILNANFPAVKNDFDKKFDIKLITPTFFLDYLKGYVEKLSRSTGIKQYSTSKNSAIDTGSELRLIIPSSDDIEYIKEEALRRNLFNPDELSKLDDLISNIPSESEYDSLERIDPVNKKILIDQALTDLRDLPSAEQISSFVERIRSGRIDRRQFYDATQKIINAIPKQFIIEKPFMGKDEMPYETPILERIPSTNVRLGTSDISELKLGDIKQFFRENDDLASQLRDRSGKKISYSKLSKGKATDGVYIGNTNAQELFNMSLPRAELFREEDLVNPSLIKMGFGIAKQQKQTKNLKIGKGIAVKEVPSYVEFGKYVLNIPQLEQQDIFNVKYKSLGTIPKYKQKPVSDVLRDFILDLLSNGKPNQRTYSQISPEERKFFEAVATDAGVFIGLGLPKTITNDDDNDIKRFEILKGQVLAGNNNQKLLSELRKLTLSLMNKGLIKRRLGMDLLMELSAM
jgi:hypothetical protein